MQELISSHSNQHVKKVRSLLLAKNRKLSKQFIVEGIHLVGEAFTAGWKIDTLVYAPESLEGEYAQHLLQQISSSGIQALPVTREIFTTLSGKDNPQGLLAVVIQKRQFIEDLPAGGIHLAAALVSPQDPGNVGTILRTLDACGAGPLFLLDGGVELFHPSCVRASMGSIFWIPVVETTFGEFNSWRQERRVLMVGTSAHARMDYEDFDSQGKPVILLLGSEQKGLTETHTAGCDILLSIPMKGHSSSLNLAVAAGILLYQIGGKK